jgi:tRNA (mo5U34)-methyltransferase
LAELIEADLATRVAAIRWYHRMDLPGVTTPGVSATSRGLPRLAFPASLAGKTVLDIGAWDGFYSFEAARRGASRVLATDSFAWSGVSWGSKDGFLLARRALGFEGAVEDRMIDVMDLDPDVLGETFDVTLFLGVLYHLENPLAAIARVASVTRGLLILETETSLNWLRYPAARFFPGVELNDDNTNFFSFNRRALIGMLQSAGFTRITVKYRTPMVRRIGRAALSLRGGFSQCRRTFLSARIVLHAERTT